MSELKVWIHERETPSAQVETFGPGDDLPEWLVERIKDQKHLFKPSEPDTRPVQTPAPSQEKRGEEKPVAEKLAEAAAGESPSSGDELVAPKRNASEADWREFAQAAKDTGEYPFEADADFESMDRTELIKACEDAGVIDPK